jgi:hypothetical protein
MAWRYFYGPLTGLGLAVALMTALADQALKLWLVFVFDLGRRGSVALGPYIDLVLSWNTGISYGLFRQQGVLGQWVLLVVKLLAVVLLWVWLARPIRGFRRSRWGSLSGVRWAMRSTGRFTGRSPILCCCTSPPPPGALTGTFSTSRTRQLSRG